MEQNSRSAKVEKKIPSALPIYLAAGAFLLCALALPIYRLWALVAAALIAAAAYVLGQSCFARAPCWWTPRPPYMPQARRRWTSCCKPPRGMWIPLPA